MEFTMDANRQYNDIVQKVVVPMMKFTALQLNTSRLEITGYPPRLRMSHIPRFISKPSVFLPTSGSFFYSPL